MTNEAAAASVSIERSTFSGLGGCPDGLCSHSIYIGQSASLSVSKSRFERGTGGCHVKTRAARVSIIDSNLDDSNGRETNYAIDLSNGATGRITGNAFVIGKNKENRSAIITVAPEGRNNPSAGLVVEGNEAALAPGFPGGTTFVADWSREPLRIGANRLGAGVKVTDSR